MKLIESTDEKTVLELTNKDYSILSSSIQAIIQYYGEIDPELLNDYQFEDFDQISDQFSQILTQINQNHERENI